MTRAPPLASLTLLYFPRVGGWGGKLPQRAVRSLQKASLGDGLATECKASLKISSRDAPIFDAEIKQTLFCVLQISSSEVRSTVGWHNIDMTYERRRSHPRCDSSSPLSHQNVCQLVANITSHGRATAPTSSLQRPMPISRQATRPRCAHLHRYVNPPLDRLLRPFARGPLAHVFLSRAPRASLRTSVDS